MAKNKIHTLKTLIEQSILLSEERKQELLTVLPTLSPEKGEELREILVTKDQIIEDLNAYAIDTAVEQEDQKLLKEMNDYLKEAGSKLLVAEEEADRSEEEEGLSDLEQKFQEPS